MTSHEPWIYTYFTPFSAEAARRLLTDELQGILERVVPQTSGA